MKKKVLIISSIIFVIVVATLFVSYGYITAEISGNETSKQSVFNGQIIKVEYSDGTETLTSKQGVFTPGSTITKTFTIKNTGNVSVKYSINLDNITNTFTRKNDITYELTSNDNILKNGMYDAKGIFPDNKLMILNKDILNVGESKTYTLKINYLNSEENQIVDSGKSLKARIVLEESKININKLIVYGNSVQNGTPTPEAPIEVQSVGERTNNLFNPKSKLEKIKAYLGIDVTNWEGSYTLFIKLKEGKTIPANVYFGYVYFTKENSSAQAIWLLSNGKFDTFNASGDRKTYGITNFTPSKHYLSGISCYGATQKTWDSIMDAFDIFLVKGAYNSLESLPTQEPYGYKIPVKVSGKNLIPEWKAGWIPPTTGVLDTTTYTNRRYTDYIPIESNKSYYVSGGGTNSNWTVYDENYNYLYGQILGSTRQIKHSSAKYVRIAHPNSNVGDIQLEEGNVATEFEPYIESITTNIYVNEPLRKIGEYSDYIDFKNGKVVRNVAEINIQTLGISGFMFDAAATKEDRLTASVYRQNTTKPKIAKDILSNYFTPVNVYSNEEGVRNIGTIAFIGFNVLKSRLTNWDESLTDAEKRSLVRDYLSTLTDLKVYYPISTDDTETIDLPNIPTHKGTNIIDVCSNNGVCASKIEVEYDE